MPELGKEADRSRKPAPGDRPTPAQSAQPHSHSAFIFQSCPHPGKPPTPARCVRPRLPLPPTECSSGLWPSVQLLQTFLKDPGVLERHSRKWEFPLIISKAKRLEVAHV